MILEAIVSTTNSDGVVNIAPMGPRVNPELTEFCLRPFKGSKTYDNLFATRRAVIHVTDDCQLYASSITGTLSLPTLKSLHDGKWWVIENACRYFAVEVTHWQEDSQRAELDCRITDSGELRPFFGFNRAKHAVIETAILATRLHLLDHALVRDELARLSVWVEKTAGEAEHAAFSQLNDFIRNRLKPE